MKTKLLIFTVLLITFFEVSAQKIYRANDGHIEMMTLVDGKTIKAESHNLALHLDYNSKVVNGVLDLKTLVTDFPELNRILKEQEDPLILRFTGTIPSVDFLSQRHDPINFNWLVTITYQGHKYVLPDKCIRTGFGLKNRFGFPNTGIRQGYRSTIFSIGVKVGIIM